MMRCSACFTLFPYTTLFRSRGERVEVREHARRRTRLRGGRRAARALRVVLRDRKSTRLNSSHSSISYAVFCLKKKRPTDLAPAIPTIARWRLATLPKYPPGD